MVGTLRLFHVQARRPALPCSTPLAAGMQRPSSASAWHRHRSPLSPTPSRPTPLQAAPAATAGSTAAACWCGPGRARSHACRCSGTRLRRVARACSLTPTRLGRCAARVRAAAAGREAAAMADVAGRPVPAQMPLPTQPAANLCNGGRSKALMRCPGHRSQRNVTLLAGPSRRSRRREQRMQLRRRRHVPVCSPPRARLAGRGPAQRRWKALRTQFDL